MEFKMVRLSPAVGKVYFKKPPIIPWEKAKRMRRIPRGVWVETRLPKRTARELGVSITEKGGLVPNYEKGPDGKLHIKGYDFYPSLSIAVRRERHKAVGVGDKDVKMARLHSALSILHADIKNNWEGKSGKEQEGVRREIEGLMEEMEGRGALSKLPIDTQNAVGRLDQALTHLNEGRVSNACADLVGVSNDIIAQRGEFRAEMARLPRRREAIIREKLQLDLSTFNLLDRLSHLKSATAKGGLKEGERRKILAEMGSVMSALGGRVEPPLKETAYQQVGKAIEHFEKGDVPRAIEQFRLANRSIVRQVSNHAWLYPGRLEQIAKAEGEGADRFKLSIARRQARLYGENLKYWMSDASHEPLNRYHISDHLKLIGGFFPGTGFERNMKNAAGYVEQGKVESAKEALTEAKKCLGMKG